MTENKNIITVKNAEGDPDTTAEIIIQNKIDFEPKVSVIIPVYNVEEYLRECLDSVINQTLKEIEIITVDDGSTDSSLEILKEYAKKDNRITVMKQENLHAGVARNAGLAVAKGEYLSFLDSDDFFELNMLEEMSKKADEDESDVTVCNADIYDDREKKYHQPDFMLKKRFSTLSCIYTDTFKNNLFNFTSPSLWNKIFMKKFILDHQLLFQSIWNCNDIGFTFSALAYSKKISIVYKTLLHYRRNTTTSITSKRSKGGANIIRAYKYVRNNLVANNQSEYLSLLIESFKEKIQYEKKHYTKAQLKLFKKEAKCLLGCDWPIFSQCFKQKHFYKKIIKILKAYLLFPYYLIKVKKLYSNQQLTFESNSDYSKNFKHHNIRKNSILMIEANPFHGECLPGASKYFVDLGYNVDVILSEKEFDLNPFSNFDIPQIQLFKMTSSEIKSILSNDIIEKYEHIYFNSDRHLNSSYFNYFKENMKFPEGKIITMCHRPEFWEENNFHDNKFKAVSLANLPILKEKDFKVLNAHYFGEIIPHQKNKITTFICVGNIESKRKNHSLLIDAVQELKQKGFCDFKIVVIARGGNLQIPEEIKQYFDFKGRLSYKDMYQEIKMADFFLTLFDTENDEHKRYLSSGTSGSFQLIYGFNIPCIIPEMFLTDFNGFTSENSLTYTEKETLSDVMGKAIFMHESEYRSIKMNLKSLSQKIYDESLSNLRELLETEKSIYQKNTFISLGENCFNRVVLTRHNIKSKRQNGELSFPFDLCVCNIKSVIKLIENNFDDYFSDLTYDNKDHIWINKKYNIRYNHDADCSASDKNKLMIRYKNRIENFKNIIDTQNAVFVFSSVNEKISIDDVNKLYFILKNKYKNFKMSFVFVNISKNELNNISNLNNEIYYKHIPHPYPKYWGEWYQYEFFSSEKGIAFESQYKNFVEYAYNKNDTQLQNVLKEYPEIMKKLLEEEKRYNKQLNPKKAYLFFPVYLIKTARMKKKIHKKVCRIIRGKLAEIFDNTLLITKQEIRDFALKNNPASDYTKKNIKKITNDIYDKFHFRKKHRILGIKFYTKNKHKELTSLLTYSIKQNELIKQENSSLKNQIEETKKELQKNRNDILTQLAEFKNKNQRNYQELNYADLLHDTIHQSNWLKDKTFSLFGWAANYSFIYLLFRTLDQVCPSNILEFGLGQTTKLTSQYIANKNPTAQLNICEHNQDWIDIYKKELAKSENIKINHLDLEFFEYDNKQNDKYKNIIQVTKNQKFDLIIVDGPVGGGKNLPRSNIHDLIKNDNLANDFIIIFDDAERKGEQETIRITKDLLTEKNIQFSTFSRNGIKNQFIITSPSREFLKFL